MLYLKIEARKIEYELAAEMDDGERPKSWSRLDHREMERLLDFRFRVVIALQPTG